MKKYRILALLLALVMVLGLTACGKDKKSDDPNHFDFDDYVLDYKGACIMYDEYGRDSLVMTFDFTNNSKDSTSAGWAITSKCMQNGVQVETAYVLADATTYESITKEYWLDVAPGVTHEVKNAFQLGDMSEVTLELSELWSGNSYTITVDPSSLERIENETSGNDEWGDLSWVYEEDEEGSEEDVAAESAAETLQTASFTDWWNGDWYGWWIISSSSGDYDGITGYWWDVCAKIEVYDDLTGALVMWDNDDGSIETPCCAAEVSFNEAGIGEHGTMMSESGAFMDQTLGHADWIVDPGLEKIDDYIWIDGIYDGEEGSYGYEIFLRPWGATWDDVTEDVTGYEDPIPSTYDWYLSFINAGQPMPDSFDATVSGGASASSAADEPAAATTAAATGNMIPFSVDGATANKTPVPISFSLPEGTWDMETIKFSYKVHLYNCPDADDAPFETPYIWIELKDSEEQLNFYVDTQYENLSETDGYTIGGIEMKGRKYDNWGFEQLQEYWGVLPSGAAVSIRLIYMTDESLLDAYAILDTISFG